MKYLTRFLVTIMSLTLTACAVHPPATESSRLQASMSWAKRQAKLLQLSSWDVTGAIAMRKADEGGSANVRWHMQQNHYFNLRLSGPLGAGTVTINGTDAAVVMRTKDGQQRTGSAQALLDEALGWRFPVQYLRYWIKGLPVPTLPSQRQLDGVQRLATLNQAGWHIRYNTYQRVQNQDLPKKLTLERAKTQIRIVIRRWTLA